MTFSVSAGKQTFQIQSFVLHSHLIFLSFSIAKKIVGGGSPSCLCCQRGIPQLAPPLPTGWCPDFVLAKQRQNQSLMKRAIFSRGSRLIRSAPQVSSPAVGSNTHRGGGTGSRGARGEGESLPGRRCGGPGRGRRGCPGERECLPALNYPSDHHASLSDPRFSCREEAFKLISQMQFRGWLFHHPPKQPESGAGGACALGASCVASSYRSRSRNASDDAASIDLHRNVTQDASGVKRTSVQSGKLDASQDAIIRVFLTFARNAV